MCQSGNMPIETPVPQGAIWEFGNPTVAGQVLRMR